MKLLNKTWLCLTLALAVKILVLTVAWVLASRQGSPSLCAWDCGYYVSIAERGYDLYQSGRQANLAFFPAFPLMVAGAMKIFGTPFAVTAVALNLGLFALALALLMKWTAALGFESPWLVAVLFTLDRFTFWSHVPYTESLFVCVLLSFLLLARGRFSAGAAGQMLIACVAGLSTAVRLVGVSLIGAWGLPRIKAYLKKPLVGAAALVLGLWGAIAYFGFLQVTQGDWRLSLKTTAEWGRYFELAGFFKSAWFLLRSAYFPTLIVLASSFWIMIRPPRSLNVTVTERLCFFFLAFIPMANSITVSLTRYMTMMLIGYVGWALLIKRWDHPAWRALWSIILTVEVWQQIHLTQKFILDVPFNWAG